MGNTTTINPIWHLNIFLILVLGTSYVLRTMLKVISYYTIARAILLEYIVAFEYTIIFHEIALAEPYYGRMIFMTYPFLLMVWRNRAWCNEYGNPMELIDEYIAGDELFYNCFVLIVAQCCGSYMAIDCLFTYWSYNLSPYHSLMLQKPLPESLTVPVPLGFLIEFGGTFAIRFCYYSLNNAQFQNSEIANIILRLFVTHIAFSSTGAYFNPILATNRKFNGVKHFIVYWLGPVIGAITASILSGRYRNDTPESSRLVNFQERTVDYD